MTKEYQGLLPEDKNIDHSICSIDWKNGLHEKWLKIPGVASKSEEQDKDVPPYILGDYTGKSGRITSGQTVRFQHIKVIELDDTGHWTINIIYTSKVYTIEESIIRDISNDKIPSRVIRLVGIKTPGALDVYDLLIETNKGLTVTKISTITGLSRNTVYRVCKNLVLHDWLKREEDLSYTVLDPHCFPRHIKLFED